MQKIAILPEIVRNQIAAGEVIERPASVVKELCENALDAGATRIQIELEDGGKRLIRVIDDGTGMGPLDLELSFVAHATSKLSDVSDLEHVASLGFRGEALASMGAIARCSILSRTRDADNAHRVNHDGGEQSPVVEAAGPLGTRIEIRELFFNTPARRAFLKRAATELARSVDIVQRLALAHEGVGFVVTHDGKRVLDVEPEMDLRGRIQRLFGADLSEALIALEERDGDIRIAGYVAPPRFARRDVTRQMWFLNGRPLKDKLLSRVLREGYRGFLADGRQPAAFLLLSMDPSRVDVNVHPAKAEVRFRDDRRLFGFLVNALRRAVRSVDMATPGEELLRTAERRENRQGALPDPGGYVLPGAGPAQGAGAFEVREVSGTAFVDTGFVAKGHSGQTAFPEGELGSAPEGAREPEGSPATRPASDEAWRARDDMRGPFVQVDRTYILRALPDGFEIVDQHALHERLSYECLKGELEAGGIESQHLLVPELVELARDELQRLLAAREEFAAIGFSFDGFGETTLALQAVPSRLAKQHPDELVRDLVCCLMDKGSAPTPAELLEHFLHSRACRSSVMAGDELSQEEIRVLLERAAKLDSDQTCPHGRPTRVRFSLSDLEKAFHRR